MLVNEVGEERGRGILEELESKLERRRKARKRGRYPHLYKKFIIDGKKIYCTGRLVKDDLVDEPNIYWSSINWGKGKKNFAGIPKSIKEADLETESFKTIPDPDPEIQKLVYKSAEVLAEKENIPVLLAYRKILNVRLSDKRCKNCGQRLFKGELDFEKQKIIPTPEKITKRLEFCGPTCRKQYNRK